MEFYAVRAREPHAAPSDMDAGAVGTRASAVRFKDMTRDATSRRILWCRADRHRSPPHVLLLVNAEVRTADQKSVEIG